MPGNRSLRGFWSRRGVRARSTIAAVVIVAVAVVIGGVALTFVLKIALTNSVEASVQQRARDVAAQIADEDIEAATPTIDAAPGDATLVQVVNAAGNVVVSSRSIAGEPAIHTGMTVTSAPSTAQVPLPFVNNAPYLVATMPVKAHDETVMVVAAQSLVAVQHVYETVTLLLLIAFPLLLLAVGWVTWVAVGSGLTSVDRIRARVDSIGGRDLHERVPVPVAQDEIARLAVTMNHMLDRLETSATAQQQFVADASHELRSPLASMRASLDVAESIGGDAAWKDAEPVLSDEVDRMTRLVGDLLLLAKADEGALGLTLADVDVDDVMSDEARRLRAQTSLAVTTAIAPVRVVADPDRLAQAVRNLIDNAARFARHEIRLSASGAGDLALLSVEDDGPGIPADEREAVMRRFVRVDGHRARDHGGAGLGLAITGEIIRLHGGYISISDSDLGGAQVSLSLPLVGPSPSTGSRR